jgi:hypothetical protein
MMMMDGWMDGWMDEQCLKLLGEWKREYLKQKINELETNSRNKNTKDLYRGINEFNKGYQPKTNIKIRMIFLQIPSLF